MRLSRDLVDEAVLVYAKEIYSAITGDFLDTRSIFMRSGAIGVADLKSYDERCGTQGESYVASTSGSNTNFECLRHVGVRLRSERTGGLPHHHSVRTLVSTLGLHANITESNCRSARAVRRMPSSAPRCPAVPGACKLLRSLLNAG